MLAGPTGCGKTRLLAELSRQGQQTLDLEALAVHRGSLLGDLPDTPQPTQKWFDSLLLQALRQLDPERPVWVEAESKKIGVLQLPDSLFEAMHRSPVTHLTAPMSARVDLWREDYPHFAADPIRMVQKLEPLKPLVGGEVLADWHAMAASGDVNSLFESIMVKHYDPCYARSVKRNYGEVGDGGKLDLAGVDLGSLTRAAGSLVGRT